MENDQETSLLKVLPKALFVWLKTLFYFIILPYKIWKASAYRLGEISGKAIVDENEEFPVYTYNKIAIDAIIFMLPAFSFFIALISSIQAYRGGFVIFIAVLFYSYFSIPVISIVKEVITMTLSVVNNLREIAKNTEK